MIPLLAAAAAPLIQELMGKGLTALAGAVANKGKEFVEEKLGVKLEERITPERALELKQVELDNEESLRNWALENRKLDIEEFREEVKDKGSARERDALFLRMGRHNWRGDLMFVLAVAVTAWLVWIVWKDQAVNEYVKGIFTLVLGRFLGYLDNIYNFEFGTTRNNRTKDATIEQLSRGGK